MDTLVTILSVSIPEYNITVNLAMEILSMQDIVTFYGGDFNFKEVRDR